MTHGNAREMKTLRKIVSLAALVLMSGGAAAGQAVDPAFYAGLRGSSASRESLSVTIAPYEGRIPVIVGAPFSAEQRAERHQVLLDGTHIDQIARPTKYWRDSNGRTRVEISVVRYETAQTRGYEDLIVIFDAVSGTQYVLDPQHHVAHRFLVETFEAQAEPAAAPGAGERSETRLENARRTVRTENLGKQVIEGLLTYGKRTTIFVDAGVEGNERPAEHVVEQWYSPELRIEVLYKSQAPNNTDNLRALTMVNRSEPNPALFQVPPGYSIVEETGTFRLKFTRN
jgi:hypothetical protein